MKSALKLLTFALLFAAAMAMGAFDPALAGVCLPNSTRFTKCIDGKAAQCTRSRTTAVCRILSAGTMTPRSMTS